MKKQKKNELCIAEKSMMGLINFNGQKAIPFITANSNIASHKKDGKATIIVGVDISSLKVPKKLWKKIIACFDYTNDPTNDIAGKVVGLGYWSMRHQIFKGELVSLNPLTFKCKIEDYKVRFTRPQRPLFESEEHLMFEKLKDPMKKYLLQNIKSIGEVK